uniref:U2266l n=1 Tax=Mycobacterium leprae TaxID=1769 RepID=Q50038_MYCLR|nr:u2266l [Mycobacterium leprae]
MQHVQQEYLGVEQ